jgi:glycyl-tRNA synthetase beta chain
MAEACDLLVEIGTEELPPKALQQLSEAFVEGIRAGLEKAGLQFSSVTPFATPRRLAAIVTDLSPAQPDKTVERRGPALAAAYGADGAPTQAARGFAGSCGVTVEELERLETPKGTWLAFRSVQPGRGASELVPEVVDNALAGLPIPRRMRWNSLKVEFVRPVHWVVMLYGEQVIDAEVLGVRAGRESRGHRFHHPAPIPISEPSAYAALLESQGHVVAAFDRRAQIIRGQVETLATQLGGQAVIDPGLLQEVTSLVEWPVAVAGSFEERFLQVPSEALVATMKGNQKYFHLVDEKGALLPRFILIANIESRDPQAVRAGNERVIRPRLADASFFWNQDRAHSLASRVEQLAGVVFQHKLGTLLDKSRRVASLARAIAHELNEDGQIAARAAELAKCDLLTEMVGEFPELQGIMGRYYAAHDGEPGAVAVALDEQYMPRQAGGALPATPTGQILAVAERLDTLVGIFGIGQSPTGDKDPFALRRAALGVLRILIERSLDLDLMELLLRAARGYDLFDPEPVADQVFNFAMERLRAYYLETGVTPDTFEAVLAPRPTRPLDFDQRVRAVTAFRALPEAASLSAANKRIHNILRKADGPVPSTLDPALLGETAEKTLAAQVDAIRAAVEPLLTQGHYTAALTELARLRPAVDLFFDQVMVMSDDGALRNNRLALLNGLRELFLRTADVSRLQT